MNIESQIVLNKFKPRPYQLPILDAIENKGYKRVVAILPRRAGKDLTAFHLCIRECLRKTKVIYYIFPTYSQAKKVIWDSITNSGERILDFIPDSLIESKNSQEMKIRFKNGSLLQLVGSDNVDSLMGTNPQGVVFSEYALQDPTAYQFIRPILTANNGWALFISCVNPNTIVLSSEGMKRIRSVSARREEYSDLNVPIWGLGGFHNAEQFYYGGKQETLIITLESGYRIECTPVHPLWNGREWIKSADIAVGCLLPIQYGQNVWGSGVDVSVFDYPDHGAIKITVEEIRLKANNDPDFWYLLGLIHADGSYNENSIVVTKKKDREIIDFLVRFGFNTRPDGIHHELSSKTMCAFLEFLGFKHGARNKEFPDAFLSAHEWQIRAFLQGLFDGDGCSHANRGTVKLTTTCESFARDLQIVLLNFGVCSSIYKEVKSPTHLVKKESVIFNLEISGYFAGVFYEKIGFRLDRKQRNKSCLSPKVIHESSNVYPVDVYRLSGYSLPKNVVANPSRMTRSMIDMLNRNKPHQYLQELLCEKFYYSPVKSIESSSSDVYDFVIPETNSFFSNGFISHNTPRGKNHLYSLYQLALQSPDWFAYKLSVEDTNHIDLQEIEKERAEGLMSEDLIQQEYFTSFEMGVEGSFYAKYMDRLRLKGQISHVPWEPGFKVNTSWDLGVRDSTAIIFFQIIGQTVRIIDCYEKTKEGLEHYIKVIESKPYSYGKHVAPHDIRVHEFGSGITRWEKARQLGITFNMADNIPIIDGIEAVRSTFNKMWIDEQNCKPLIKALENYRQEYDSKKKVYKTHPLHDWSSNFADSMRYLCVSLPKTKDGTSPEELDRRYREAMYGSSDGLPYGFSNKNDFPRY